MPSKRIDQIFKELPMEKKLLTVGSLILFFSVFLPWYSDLDTFKTGFTYLGVTGPMYLLGLSVLALAATNLVFLTLDVYGIKSRYVKAKSSTIYLFSGLTSLYLLLLVNSVYFHNQFGVNITLKESQFGMFIAFLGMALNIIGSYLASRDKVAAVKEFTEETRDSFVRMPDDQMRMPRNIEQFKDSHLKKDTLEKDPQLYRSDL